MSNKPRPTLERQNASTNVLTAGNRPRPKGNENAPVMGRMSSEQRQQMAQTIGAGPGKMHGKSHSRLHEERAYIYDQMSKGNALTAGVHRKKDQMASRVGLSTLNKQDRKELERESKDLKPYKGRMKDKNQEANEIESLGKNLKHVKTAATVANHIGTGVALANPLAGVVTKAVAKGVGAGAGIGAAVAFDRASKAYAKNVDENATGMSMLDSHISQEKASLTEIKRNKMIVSTGASLAMTAGGFGVDAAVQGASTLARSAISTGYDVAKKGAKFGIKQPFENREQLHKSEIVNVMQHQRTAERAKTGLVMKPTATVLDKSPPTLQRQNATQNLHQGDGPQLQRQNASRPLKK